MGLVAAARTSSARAHAAGAQLQRRHAALEQTTAARGDELAGHCAISESPWDGPLKRGSGALPHVAGTTQFIIAAAFRRGAHPPKTPPRRSPALAAHMRYCRPSLGKLPYIAAPLSPRGTLASTPCALVRVSEPPRSDGNPKQACFECGPARAASRGGSNVGPQERYPGFSPATPNAWTEPALRHYLSRYDDGCAKPSGFGYTFLPRPFLVDRILAIRPWICGVRVGCRTLGHWVRRRCSA